MSINTNNTKEDKPNKVSYHTSLHSTGTAGDLLTLRSKDLESNWLEELKTDEDGDGPHAKHLFLQGKATERMLDLIQHGANAVLNPDQKITIELMMGQTVKEPRFPNDVNLDYALLLGIVNYLQTLQMSQLANAPSKSPVEPLQASGRAAAMNIIEGGQK
jgi:hypothetical protein